MRVMIVTKKGLLTAAAVAAVLIVGVLLVLLGGDNPASDAAMPEEYELAVLAGKHRELPVYSVRREDKKIALTIDAAWDADKTDFILAELERQGVKATFYLCGVWVKANPDKVKAIAAAGHEIGNHSVSHPHMSKLSAEQIEKEILDLHSEMEKLGVTPGRTFRAPFGEYNDLVISTTRRIGFEPVQWSLDTVDWKEERSVQTILDAVLPKLAPGAIILCHNNGYKIESYLPTLLTQAKEQGYEFVTVSELLLPGDTMIDVNGVQKPAS